MRVHDGEDVALARLLEDPCDDIYVKRHREQLAITRFHKAAIKINPIGNMQCLLNVLCVDDAASRANGDRDIALEQFSDGSGAPWHDLAVDVQCPVDIEKYHFHVLSGLHLGRLPSVSRVTKIDQSDSHYTQSWHSIGTSTKKGAN